MTERDRPQFTALLQAVGATFGREVTTPLNLAWWVSLSDLPYDDVRRGATRAMAENRFFPTPSEIRALSGDAPIETRVILAWDKVRQTIRSLGGYKSVSFDDHAINAAVRSIGGWAALCGCEKSDLDTWKSKEFDKAYRAYSTSGVSAEAAAFLPGFFAGEANATESAQRVHRIETGLKPALLLGAPSANQARGLIAELAENTDSRLLPAARGEG